MVLAYSWRYLGCFLFYVYSVSYGLTNITILSNVLTFLIFKIIYIYANPVISHGAAENHSIMQN